jgi:hypothetical protein
MVASRSVANDNALAAGGAGDIVVFAVIRGARGLLRVAADGTAAVKLDAVALAGDAVALAGADGRGAVVAACWDGRGARGDIRPNEGRSRVVVGVVEGGSRKARGELLNGGRLAVVSLDYVTGLVGLDWLGRLDLRGAEGAALGNLWLGGLGGLAGPLLGLGGRFAGRDIEDVQVTAGRGLDGRGLRAIVHDMVAIDNIIVPVSLARLDGSLEAESSLPAAGLGWCLVLGEGELTAIVVPRAKKVDSLDAGGDAKRERKLHGRHYYIDVWIFILIFLLGVKISGWWARELVRVVDRQLRVSLIN